MKSNEVTGTSYFFTVVTVTGTSYFLAKGTVTVMWYIIFVTSNALIILGNLYDIHSKFLAAGLFAIYLSWVHDSPQWGPDGRLGQTFN